jgi:predicted lipoprotein with Yx(FWY)xxD motif
MRNRMWAVPLLAGAAAVITACGGGSSPGHPSGSASVSASAAGAGNATASKTVVIQTRSTGIGTVLTNSQGRTLYWFAIDTPTTSNCTGSCTSYWPPLLGKPVAAAGAALPKGFGTISRSGGEVQATYDGHPLYTYVGDTSAGMTSGNGSNASGGLWWAMTPSGAKPGASTAHPSPSSSSSGSGSGGGW